MLCNNPVRALSVRKEPILYYNLAKALQVRGRPKQLRTECQLRVLVLTAADKRLPDGHTSCFLCFLCFLFFCFDSFCCEVLPIPPYPRLPCTHPERYCVPRSLPCRFRVVGSIRSHSTISSSLYFTVRRGKRQRQGQRCERACCDADGNISNACYIDMIVSRDDTS